MVAGFRLEGVDVCGEEDDGGENASDILAVMQWAW
jgi:hypothetical protein